MSLRFQADADLDKRLVAGVLALEPAIDFQTAAAAKLDGVPDYEVLARAASEGRILISHDRKTMPAHFRAYLAQGATSPGVLLVSRSVSLQVIVEAIVLIWAASAPSEWVDRIYHVPSLTPYVVQW